jgi:hypothetical protein
MRWLEITGGLFLAWLVLVFLFTPGIVGPFVWILERQQ